MSNKRKAVQKSSKGNTKVDSPPIVEEMFSVLKTGISEIRVDKVTVINGRVSERELVSKDIVIIAKHKLWKAIYKLITRRNDDGGDRTPSTQHRGTGISDEDEPAHNESSTSGDVSSEGVSSSSGRNGNGRKHDDTNKRPVI